MTTPTNLLFDGYQKVAEHVTRSIAKSNGGNHCVVVRDNGAVRLYASRERMPANDEPYLVGTYSKRAPIEHIEDDLIAHMRERFRRNP